MTRFIMSVVVVACAAAFLPSCSGESSPQRDPNAVILGGMRMMVTTKSQSATYAREKDGWFHAISTRSDMAMSLFTVGRDKKGKPDIALGDSQRQTLTDLPDRAAGEFEKLRLIRNPEGAVFLEMRLRSTVDLPRELNAEMKDEVEFVQGDWFEYEAGKTVVFRLSDKGMKTSAASVKNSLEEQFTPMLRQILLEQLKQQRAKEGWKISEADLGRIIHVETEVEIDKNLPNTLYTVKDKRISFDEDRPFDADVTVWVGVTDKNFKK